MKLNCKLVDPDGGSKRGKEESPPWTMRKHQPRIL